MEKKKLKLSVTGTSKKTINSIEQAKSQSKNSVIIEKKSGKISRKQNFQKPAKQNFNFKANTRNKEKQKNLKVSQTKKILKTIKEKLDQKEES